MEIFEATMTSKGQFTFPAKLRSALGLKSGDKLVFQRDDGGKLHVTARTSSLGDLIGAVRTAPGPVDGATIDAWIDRSRGARWPSGPT